MQTRALPTIEHSRTPWSDRELALLLYGVLKFGEGQWTNIMEGTEFDKTELSNMFELDKQPRKRSAAEISQKWQALKIQMIQKITSSGIRSANTTHQDWIMAALQQIVGRASTLN